MTFAIVPLLLSLSKEKWGELRGRGRVGGGGVVEGCTCEGVRGWGVIGEGCGGGNVLV